jgi:hypothetical protein
MRLARIVHRNNTPPIGTIVQYKQSVDGGYEVYFPGVHGYAPMGDYGFSTHFKDLDDETS